MPKIVEKLMKELEDNGALGKEFLFENFLSSTARGISVEKSIIKKMGEALSVLSKTGIERETVANLKDSLRRINAKGKGKGKGEGVHKE